MATARAIPQDRPEPVFEAVRMVSDGERPGGIGPVWVGMRREPIPLRTIRGFVTRIAGAPPFGPVRGQSADTRFDRPMEKFWGA
jgi:hypothetical protein